MVLDESRREWPICTCNVWFALFRLTLYILDIVGPNEAIHRPVSRPDACRCKEGEKLMASERQASALQVGEKLPTNLQMPFNGIVLANVKSASQKTHQSHIILGVKLASNE